MPNLPVHGLLPAHTFLNAALAAEMGMLVQLSIKPYLLGGNRHELCFTRKDDIRAVNLGRIISRSDCSTLPSNEELAKVFLTLRPLLYRFAEKRGKISFTFDGFEQIPQFAHFHHTQYKAPLHYNKFERNDGYFDTHSPLIREYERRWTIETSDELARVSAARRDKLLNEGPYQTD
jgi:hypothetical protein